MESKKIESFKDLIVWQKGIELVNEIYKVTKHFPKEESYGLTSQAKVQQFQYQQILPKVGEEEQPKIISSFWKFHADHYMNLIL